MIPIIFSSFGVLGGELRVRVAAPPVEGAANTALLRLIARELGIASGAVRLVSGETARRKVIAASIDQERVVARWPDLRV
jgi:uncharacterized protein YggU (UPF0235/DUF167 family)